MQRATDSGVGWEMSDISSHLERWESRSQECDQFVFQTEKIQTEAPDSCKVFIIRSLVPKDMVSGLLKVLPTANYKTAKEYILEQASLQKEAFFYNKGQHDKPVSNEVDTLLAQVTALKVTVRLKGERDKASNEKESHIDDTGGGRPPTTRRGHMQ